MKPRKPGETDESYIRRLEARNKDMEQRGKWAQKVGRAVTWLACDASLAFQAMAEKAGVRSHPSVTAVVKAFDTIAHPQWTDDAAEMPDLTFPTDWDLDPPDAWSGDADMELNAGIAMAMDYLESRRLEASDKEFKHISEIMEALERPLQGILDKAIPKRAERKAIEIPEDATREELAEAINAVSWYALDLAQDMHFANHMLRRDLRAAAYRRVCGELYGMSNLHVRAHDPKFDIKVVGDEIPF
jgi:hypothetical protein